MKPAIILADYYSSISKHRLAFQLKETFSTNDITFSFLRKAKLKKKPISNVKYVPVCDN